MAQRTDRPYLRILFPVLQNPKPLAWIFIFGPWQLPEKRNPMWQKAILSQFLFSFFSPSLVKCCSHHPDMILLPPKWQCCWLLLPHVIHNSGQPLLSSANSKKRFACQAANQLSSTTDISSGTSGLRTVYLQNVRCVCSVMATATNEKDETSIVLRGAKQII